MKIRKLFFGGVIASAMALGLVSFFGVNKNKTIESKAYAEPNNLFINGTSFAANPYFKNGDTTTFTGDSDHYNAYYNDATGVLTLNGYSGERIKCTSGESFTITLVNENEINVTDDDNRLYCIESSSYLTINGSGSLSITANKAGTSYDAIGIYAHDGLRFEGSANVSIDMTGVEKCGAKGIEVGTGFYTGYSASILIDMLAHEDQSTSVHGIYIDKGGASFATSGETTINIEDHNNYEDSAIFLYGLDDEVSNNGCITVGGGGPITLTMTGEDGFANGIVGDHNEKNTKGKFSFSSSAPITITGFSRAIWNKSMARPSASADITFSNNANIIISSDREGTCMGVVSERNGISVQDSHLSITTNEHPIHTAGYNGGLNISNTSTFGFDVYGNSTVLIKSNYGIHTASDATCDFGLTSSGYFRFMKLDGTFPSLASTFLVKLHPGTRLTNETHFTYGDTPATDGGRQIVHYSGYDDIIEFLAFNLPGSPNVEVNGHTISGSKNYYVNGTDNTQSDPSGYNAYYDKDNCALYLKGYEGGTLSFYGTNDGLFRIYVESDSTITSDIGIDVRGAVSLEISSNNFSDLTIVSSSSSGNATCIDAANGSVTFSGLLNLRLTAEVTSEETGLARGIRVGYQYNSGSVYFEDDVDAQIVVYSNHKADQQSAIFAATNIVFNTTNSNNRKQKFDTSSVVGGSYAIYCFNTIYFTSYKDIRLNWSDGDSCGPTYPKNKVEAVTNGAYNIDLSSKSASILYGESHHVEVLNGYTTNAASGNYLLNKKATFSANDIAGLTFVSWNHLSGTGTFVDDSQTSKYGELLVLGDEVVEATYDFVDEVPFFDTKGTYYGSFRYKFKGSPAQVDAVSAADRTVVQSNITQTMSFSDSEVPNGSYCLCVHYGVNRLYTDAFTVDHSAAAHDYNVTYHAGAGTGDNVVVKAHGSYKLADGSTMFTAPAGKRFLKWALNSVEGVRYDVGQDFDIYFNKDFYAIYEDIPTYTMTFVGGTNVTGGSMTAQVKYEGEQFELPESTFEHNAHTTFDYWDIGGVHYNAGQKIDAESNVTATANYVLLPQYTLSFNAGEGSGSMESETKYTDEVFTLPDPTFTEPENFEFSNWEINGVEKQPGDTIEVTGNIEAVAKYTRIQVTISFNAGDGSGTMENVVHGKGTNYTLPASTFTAPTHKHFKCWLIDETEHDAGESILISSDTSLTAVYEDTMYEVTFSAGEGTGSMTGTSLLEGSTYVLPASTFTAPEGKEFDGWMVGGVKHTVGDQITINSNTTITAVYKDPTAPVTPDIPDTPATPEKSSGLSGGAIAGIVIGSVAVLGLGGFSVVWFGIKKKSFADLVAVFKKK